MRAFLIALCLVASFGFVYSSVADASEFASDTTITEHHWGRGYRHGRGGRGRGHRGGDYYYQGGGYCY